MVVRTRVRWSKPPRPHPPTPNPKQRLSQVSRSSRPADLSGNRGCWREVSHVCPWLFMAAAVKRSLCQVTAGSWTPTVLDFQGVTSGRTYSSEKAGTINVCRECKSQGLKANQGWFWQCLSSVFCYFWRWLGPSDAPWLNSIKKCAWVIESWEPGPEPDAGGKYIYRKITENTCLLIFCVDLSLRIIYSLLRGT